MNIYIFLCAIAIFIVYAFYWFVFNHHLEYKLSHDVEVWAQFGDYVGGILNPLLSFITIVLLIKSLSLQNEANSRYINEINNHDRIERLRSFEVLFFNLISSQKNLFDSLKINSTKNTQEVFICSKAVIYIEENIRNIRSKGGDDNDISNYLENIDSEDQIFGIVRAFYIIVKIISERLSDSEGFSFNERSTHYKALINFTDFAQIRLIMIGIQFMNYESTKYLRDSKEFRNVIEELGLNYEMY